VCLERVRVDARIITPHLLQQRLPRYQPLAGAREVAQDRGLFLGQAHFVAVGVEEKLRAGPKRVGADRENGVLARFVLAQLGADARKQHGKAEGLSDIIIGARFEAQDGVGIGILASENNDRLREPVPAQDPHGFTAVEVGQADIHEHQIDLSVLDGLNALRAVFDRHGLKLLVQRKLFRQCVAQFGIIVDDKNPTRVRHFNLPQLVAAPAVILPFDDTPHYGNLLNMI
jgi:hypothetical protein